jgi:hypothetical protein
MIETKLYQSLESLNIYELNRLSRYLNSPYFNRNQKIIQFFECIEPSLRGEEIQAPTKYSIWAVIQPGKTYDDIKFRKFTSDLLKLYERFLAQERFESNPLHQANYLLDAVTTKKIDKLYKSSMRTAKRLSDMHLERNASYYYYQYEFERGFYNIDDYEINRSKVSNIENIAENLDRFYLGEKLRYYCTVLSRQNVLKHEYQMLFIEDIIRHVESHDYQDIPPIIVYHQILKMYQEPEDRSHYDQLRALIRQYVLKFPELEAKEIIDSALNYSIRQINKGKREFLREIFELYQEALERELLYINGEMTPWSFKNIVITALRLKEFAWTEAFINSYNEKLNPKYRENALSFNLAQLYFYRKDYPKVIQMLQQVEYDDLSYHLNSKTFLMGSYYELDEMEAMISLLDSFRVYLNRNKNIPNSRKTHYLNMIKVVKKLSKIIPGDKKQIEKIKKEIQELNAIASKGWIMEKIADLEES